MTPHASAVMEVLHTAELLEQILSDLSIDRLLIVKRVCRFWNAVISTSPSLQRNLYQRPDLSRDIRDYNPLFEDFFSDIGCADVPMRSQNGSRGPPAHLKISPIQMRKLLTKCPPALRTMSMFQPPCRYWLTLPSASPWDFTVKFMNEADTPVMRAVEKASMIIELEADKRRNLRRNLEHRLRPGVRGANMRHRYQNGRAGAVNA
ncbi:hypothetical protein, variant [Verruconis gallopava]|uniref:F-box domain-containing protein n=1 Tax=Verruconis gallopava TaxID=253628 RepID=A0A0D2B8Q6_9PEZI|nr:uncharacterized protein PV09_01587 [Verruconis gallopava]XP_016217514.1 hypothetical protein, variant [Verruconis gallopava]KIW07644.1 hypothetical protein PV09_01587 [Verruconis gallopava]KIW07645.1 hypothetical protein, variant [Verruconis gallopava]